MEIIDFGSALNTPTGDLFPGAIVKLRGRIAPFEAGSQAALGQVGLNAQGMTPYLRGLVPVDLMKAGDLRITDYANVYDPSATVDRAKILAANPAAKPSWNASDIGMDDYGWPTTAPSGQQVMVTFNTADQGFSADQSGTYDVTFPPNFDWTLAGSAGMTRTDYNLAAGTCVINIAAEVKGPSPRFVFNSYNGVANTFPPYSPSRVFKAIKRGEDENNVLTARSLASLRGLTSAVKPHTGYRGYLRFMSPNGINRPQSDTIKWARTRADYDINRLGQASGAPQFLIEDQIKICKAIGANLWVNLHDNNTVATNKKIAQKLNAQVPTGMQFVVEYSNEIYFNYAFGFAQTGEMRDRSPTADLLAQYGIEVQQFVTNPFEEVFLFNDPRYIPGIGVQSAQANYGFISRILDQGTLKSHIKCIFTGPYIAGGISGVSIGSYTEQSLFTKASRDKAGVDDAGFLTDMFAAQYQMSQKVYNDSWKPFLAAIKKYATDNGFAEDRYITGAYELAWQHYNMNNNHRVSLTGAINGTTLTVSINNGPPLRPNDVLVKSDIATGTTVVRQLSGGTAGGAGDYEVSISQTSASGTITTSTSMYARAVGRLLGQALRDPRAGLAQVEQIQWLRGTPGIYCLFDHTGAARSMWQDNNNQADPQSIWGMEEGVGREAIDDPYKTVSAYLQANG